MFEAFSIDNDLAYVDAKIRNYYEFDDAKSDVEITKLDEAKAGDVEKPQGRKSRKEKAQEVAKEVFEEEQEALKEDPREEIPFEDTMNIATHVDEEETPIRRTRRIRK